MALNVKKMSPREIYKSENIINTQYTLNNCVLKGITQIGDLGINIDRKLNFIIWIQSL